MPLEPCRDCGTHVSDKAGVCPHCGVPIPLRTPEARAAWRRLRGPGPAAIAAGVFLGLLLWAVVALAAWLVFEALGVDLPRPASGMVSGLAFPELT